jgi:formate dehydrogenase subunit gamma
MTSQTSATITRFDLSQRLQHIILITSFTLLALTGLPQLFVLTSWAQGFMALLGGLDGVRKIHHLAAMLLVFVLVYHVFSVIFDLIAGRPALMLPRWQDGQDAQHAFAYLLGRRADKPQYDRFDFRQKLEYWALIWGTFLMGLTGLVLMFPQLVAQFLPGVVIYAAKAAHGLEALLAIASIIIWHMYNTHLAEGMWPFDSTIFTGQISRERMMAEHPLDYQRLLAGTGETSPQSTAAPDLEVE